MGICCVIYETGDCRGRNTILMQVMRRDLVSKAAQTVLRENESQTLNWDITAEPTPNPSKFPKGRGLKYPIIYNPGI